MARLAAEKIQVVTASGSETRLNPWSSLRLQTSQEEKSTGIHKI
jgi:hypothetical protein